MVWHVHYRKEDKKFNIWSAIVDAYILNEWVDEKVIVAAYQEKASEHAVVVANANIRVAKEHGCSATKLFRCNLEKATK